MSKEILIPLDLIDMVDPIIGEPYRDSVSAGLADAVEFLITEPIEEPNSTVANKKRLKQVVKILDDASLFTPSAKELEAGWKTLLEGMRAQSLRKKFLSFYLADQLLHQTSEPLSKRVTLKYPKTEETNLTKAGLASLFKINPQEDPNSSHKKVAQATEAFRKGIDKTLERKPKDLNTIIEQFETMCSVFESTNSLIYQGWENWLNPLTKTWVDQMADKCITLTKDPYCLDLLLDGKLETISPIVRFEIWLRPWIFSPDSKKVELLDYFLTNESLQSYLWLDYSIVDTEDGPQNAVQPVFDWIFKQDTDKITAFFNTLSLSEFKFNKASFIQMLMGLYGVSQTRFEDINKEAVTKNICDLAEKADLRSKLTTELDIIENRTPGLLYLEQGKFEVKAKFPRRDQTKEGLLGEMRKKGLQIVYISTTDWDRKEQFATHVVRQTGVEIGIAGKILHERWGEVGLIGPDTLPSMLNLMSTTLGQNYEEIAFSRLVELDNDGSKRGLLDNPYVIVPLLLRIDDPLFILQKSGILAVEQEADTVNFIVNSKPLNIETDVKRLAIQGKLTNRELTFVHSHDNFESSPLFYFMNAVSLLGRIPNVEGPISKDDLREIHSSMKYWNKEAREENRARLMYEIDKNNPIERAQLVPCLVTDRIAYLASLT